MEHATATPAATTAEGADDQVVGATTTDELVDDELLVEEISIDGMCGVY